MNDPVPIREGVEHLLRHLDAPRADTVQSIFEHWATVVGPGIAEHTRPVSVEDGCLVIAVDDPAWASHLQWSQEELVAGLNEALGADQITRVRAVVRRTR